MEERGSKVMTNSLQICCGTSIRLEILQAVACGLGRERMRDRHPRAYRGSMI